MKDDYLWDKSGEPDKDVEQLEQLLGNLRYRRPDKPLPLPQRAPVVYRRTFTPALAAAAAVLFVMVAAGVWFALGAREQRETQGISAINVRAGSAQEWFNADGLLASTLRETKEQVNPPAQTSLATSGTRSDRTRRSPVSIRREMTTERMAKSTPSNRRERISEDEGIAAREQLMKALHLASSKLQQVQKKVKDNKGSEPVS